MTFVQASFFHLLRTHMSSPSRLLLKQVEGGLTSLTCHNTDPPTNLVDIFCPRENCSSKILRANAAQLVERTDDTWSAIKAGNSDETISVSTHQFWAVDDIFTFENIGFTKCIQTSDTASDNTTSSATLSAGLRLLACAECDHGPLGYQDTRTTSTPNHRTVCLIAVDHVRYAQVTPGK
jgi:hypothetical protein